MGDTNTDTVQPGVTTPPIQFEDSFELPVPPDEAWDLLNDVPRIAHCMPGASEVETVGPNQWVADVEVKIGPMSMGFNASIRSEHVSVEKRIARLTMTAEETKGKGTATAVVRSSVTGESPTSSRVSLQTELSFGGQMAKHLRGPIVTSVGRQLTKRFAQRLREELSEAKVPGGVAAGAPSDRQAPDGSFWKRLTSTLRGVLHRLGRAARSAGGN
jgi:carbon monoxide dehydrogenase subunit G